MTLTYRKGKIKTHPTINPPVSLSSLYYTFTSHSFTSIFSSCIHSSSGKPMTGLVWPSALALLISADRQVWACSQITHRWRVGLCFASENSLNTVWIQLQQSAEWLTECRAKLQSWACWLGVDQVAAIRRIDRWKPDLQGTNIQNSLWSRASV